MGISLATDFKPYVDEQFSTESRKSLLTNQDFDWTGAHSVKVYKVGTSTMNDYDRSGTDIHHSRYGEIQGLDATTEEFTLKKDRSFTFAVDTLDVDETKGSLGAAAALARQNREVCIPEVDAYTYSVMCEGAGNKPAVKVLNPTNIADEILAANTALDDAEVPEVGRVLVVTPTTYRHMKKSKDIIMETDIGNDLRLKGVISMVDGATVVKVPHNRVPAGFGFMLAHPVATVAPTKLEDFLIHKNPPGIHGTLVEGRICYDAFVLENKTKAIYYQAVE